MFYKAYRIFPSHDNKLYQLSSAPSDTSSSVSCIFSCQLEENLIRITSKNFTELFPLIIKLREILETPDGHGLGKCNLFLSHRVDGCFNVTFHPPETLKRFHRVRLHSSFTHTKEFSLRSGLSVAGEAPYLLPVL
jgi:hypothetical protein